MRRGTHWRQHALRCRLQRVMPPSSRRTGAPTSKPAAASPRSSAYSRRGAAQSRLRPMNRSRSAPWSVVATLLSACAAGSPAVQRGTVAPRPDTFVSLADVDPSIAIELRYFGSHNFPGHPVRGYKAEKCLLTRLSALDLKEVQEYLRPVRP